MHYKTSVICIFTMISYSYPESDSKVASSGEGKEI